MGYTIGYRQWEDQGYRREGRAMGDGERQVPSPGSRVPKGKGRCWTPCHVVASSEDGWTDFPHCPSPIACISHTLPAFFKLKTQNPLSFAPRVYYFACHDAR